VGPAKALLARWDVFDLKTVLRGVHARSSPGEIVDSLMPAATLADVELLELAKSESVQEVVDTLATWRLPYARPLEEALESYRTHDVTAPLELALDRWYFRSVSERLTSKRGSDRRLMQRVMGTIVDVENLRTALRLMGLGGAAAETAEYFLEGGSEIGPERFSALCAAEDVDQALEVLKRTRYAKPLEDAAVMYLKEGTLSVLERALEDLLTREMLAARRGDVLGLGVVISYLWAQQNEVSNIRVAITGREMGLPEERMRRELILV
jgi:V/A-type H+-transporting ATPase subunit C